MDFGLAEGLMAPREKPLAQPAARWLLRGRPFEPELVDSLFSWCGWAPYDRHARILCPAVCSSQVPGRKKTGGHEGRSRSLKRKLSANAERQDWNSRNESSQARWAQHQRGISPSMTHTQRECHQRAGETCTPQEKGFSWRGKKVFSHTSVFDAVRVKYRKGTQFNQVKALSMKGSWVWAKWLYKHLTLNIIQCLFQCSAAFST